MVYLQATYDLGKRISNIWNHVIFPAKIQISKPIDVSVFMFDLNITKSSINIPSLIYFDQSRISHLWFTKQINDSVYI